MFTSVTLSVRHKTATAWCVKPPVGSGTGPGARHQRMAPCAGQPKAASGSPAASRRAIRP